ncbi:MAG: hypothetical protein J5I35_06240 [Methanothrix harundinacea]|nr:hypothetical protein [Methanothrix harundinacea]
MGASATTSARSSVASKFGKVKDSSESFFDLCRYFNAEPEEVAHIDDHRYFDFPGWQKEGGIDRSDGGQGGGRGCG